MSLLSFEFLTGAARAVVFAVFALAGIGKLLACSGRARSFCRKAALDFSLAGLSLLPGQAPALLAGTLALGVGIGGGLAEYLRHDPACRCFGLMNRALHRYRHAFRAALALSGAFIAAAASGPTAPAGVPAWAGAACALATVLLLAVHALGTSMRDPAAGAAPPRHTNQTFGPAQHAGLWPDGRPATLGELRRGQAPLAILFSMHGCPDCQAIKAEVMPYCAALPFPLHIVNEGGAAGAACLADSEGVLRRRLGIASFPALVVFDPIAFNVAAPFALGVDEIRRQLMQLVLAAR